WDRAIIVPIEAVWEMHDEEHVRGNPVSTAPRHLGPPWAASDLKRVPAIVVKPLSVTDAYQLRAKYRSRDATAVFPAEILVPLYSLCGDARDLIAWMAIGFQVLLIVAVLLVIVAVLAGRQQSIGVLRALGAPRSFIFLTVWLQAVLMIASGV